MRPTRRDPRTASRLIAVVATVLVVLAGVAAYQQLFSTFVWWDDEGYVMLTLSRFLAGEPLYDATFTQYGPFYYLVRGGVHLLLGLPVSHDIVRFWTLAEWLAVAGGAMLLVRRLTARWSFALIAFVLTFLYLDRLALEPGHPQSLAALLVTLALVLVSFAKADGSSWLWAVLGVPLGGLLLIKLNIGAILLLGVTLALSKAARPFPGRAWVESGAVLSLFALPAVMLVRQGFRADSLLLPLTVATGLAAVTYAAKGRETRPAARSGDVALVAGVLVLSFTGVLAATLLHGTSPDGLVHGVVLQHLDLDRSVFRPAAVPHFAYIGVAASLPAVLLARRGSRAPLAAGGALLLGLVVVLLAAYAWPGVLAIGDAVRPRGYPSIVLGLAPFLAWTVLFEPGRLRPSDVEERVWSYGRGGAGEQSIPLARLLLAVVAVTLPLIAYPVPGSQVTVGTFPLLLVAVVAAADWVRAAELGSRRPATVRRGASPRRVALLLLLATAVGALAFRTATVWNRRASLVPLGLPGSARLRVPENLASEYRRTVAILRDRCDTFVFGRHGRASFYFWSRLDPPTGWNATAWPRLLDRERQLDVVEALQAVRRPCVVRGPGAPAGEERAGPLASFLEEEFAPSFAAGRFEVWTRRVTRPSPGNIASEPAGSGVEK